MNDRVQLNQKDKDVSTILMSQRDQLRIFLCQKGVIEKTDCPESAVVSHYEKFQGLIAKVCEDHFSAIKDPIPNTSCWRAKEGKAWCPGRHYDIKELVVSIPVVLAIEVERKYWDFPATITPDSQNNAKMFGVIYDLIGYVLVNIEGTHFTARYTSHDKKKVYTYNSMKNMVDIPMKNKMDPSRLTLLAVMSNFLGALRFGRHTTIFEVDSKHKGSFMKHKQSNMGLATTSTSLRQPLTTFLLSHTQPVSTNRVPEAIIYSKTSQKTVSGWALGIPQDHPENTFWAGHSGIWDTTRIPTRKDGSGRALGIQPHIFWLVLGILSQNQPENWGFGDSGYHPNTSQNLSVLAGVWDTT
ncbi:hypothetical protein BYT27DRAFT_7209288 [Phlegmacium glaucopus]|nr:hypothetical protein BYT27DRAFT_7209288 [Phlegmacium glaucopus]